MKMVSSFDSFLANTVNLNVTRVDLLDNSSEAIKKFIRESDFAPRISAFFKHGSWAHKTIIKPVDGRAFDADLVLFVQPVEGWEAADYLDDLERIFSASQLYADKLQVYSHCVTIEYSGERKIDISPCVVDRQRPSTIEVCNGDENAFEVTDPEGYTSWITRQNRRSGGNSFRKLTRLIKYVRDIKTTFTCPSFLLTTLLGMQIEEGDKDTSDFSDLPSALKTVIGRLNQWLMARPEIPVVPNPSLSSEDQASQWSADQYLNFRNRIRTYSAWIDDAYNETNLAESLTKWRRVFGDDFGEGKKAIALVESAALALVDDVDVVRKSGLIAVASKVVSSSWIKPSPWHPATIQQQVLIRAYLLDFRRGRLFEFPSGFALEPNQSIEFVAYLGGVFPSDAYRTEWRITNSGPVALKNREPRGGFEMSHSPHMRREPLKYRGVHMAEAFVIRNGDNLIAGQSYPFYVVIE